MALLKQITHLLALFVCFEICCSAQSTQGLSGATLSAVFKSRVYTYHPGPATFLRAVQQCAVRDGAVLTSLADNEEKTFIYDLLGQVTDLPNAWQYQWAWVGGHKVDANWKWLRTETPIDSTLWGSGRPMGTASDHRTCTVLFRHNLTSPWFLADSNCDGNVPFICAK